MKKQLAYALTYAMTSGILIGTSYIPFPPWALFFCLVPLWLCWFSTNSYKETFLTGWVTQFVLTLIGFHWIPGTVVDFGKMPFVVGILALIALASFSSLHIPLAGLVWRWFNRKFQIGTTHSILILAFFTYLLEQLNPQVFPWNFGYAWLWGQIPAVHLADIIGFEGLSFLTLILNGWILFTIQNTQNPKHFRKNFIGLLLFFGLVNILGFLNVQKWHPTNSIQRVMITQANIGNLEKQWQIYGNQYKVPTLEKFLALTKNQLKLTPDIDWMLWPETAIPEFMNPEYAHKAVHKGVLDFIKQTKTPLVSGAYFRNPRTNGESNSIFFFDSTGQTLSTYKKSILLAFGEYMPGSQWFPWLLNIFPEVSDFERGEGPNAYPFLDTKLGPQICYEGLHPWFVRKSVQNGAEILINVTNDSWFGHTFESYQHLYMTLARAIEFRRPLIRSTNTGISTAILADGTLLEASPQKTEWTGVFEIKYLKNPPQTIYSRFGIFVPIVFALGVFIGFIRKSRLA